MHNAVLKIEGEPFVAPKWPAWARGPQGERRIFNSEAEVPSGWKHHDQLEKRQDPAQDAAIYAERNNPAFVAMSFPPQGAPPPPPPAQASVQRPTQEGWTYDNGDGTEQWWNGSAWDGGNHPIPSASAKAPPPPPSTGAASLGTPEVDAAGVAWDPSRHAASKGKTNAGLWRMKVGVSRPANEAAPTKLDL